MSPAKKAATGRSTKAKAAKASSRKRPDADAEAKGSSRASRFGDAPVGPVLSGLLELSFPKGPFQVFSATRSFAFAKEARERYGVELIGRYGGEAALFGVPIESSAPLDERPVIGVDEDFVVPPRVLAATLPDFLSLEAFAPGANWSALTPETCDPQLWSSVQLWGTYRRDAKHVTGEKGAAAIAAKLCTLPGVRIPEEPWRLRENLPRFTPVAKRGTEGGAKQEKRELADRIKEMFDEVFADELTVTYLDDILFEGDAIEIHVGVDAPEELGTRLARHDVVQAPFRRFRERVLSELTSRPTRVRLFVGALDEADEAGGPRFESRLRRDLERIGRAAVFLELMKPPAQT